MTKGLTVHELAETRGNQIAKLAQLQAERQSAGLDEAVSLDRAIEVVTDEIRALDALVRAAVRSEN